MLQKKKEKEGEKKSSLGHLLSLQTLIMRDLIFAEDQNGIATYSTVLSLQEYCIYEHWKTLFYFSVDFNLPVVY